MGDAHCKNRPSSLMNYKGILQLMQSTGQFLAVRLHRAYFSGEGGVGLSNSIKWGSRGDVGGWRRRYGGG